MDLLEAVARDGFAILPNVLSIAECDALIAALAEAHSDTSTRKRAGSSYAIRNLLSAVTAVRDLAASPSIRRIINPILGPDAIPVKGTLFDKTPDANWKVFWHQDVSIALKEKIETPGFGAWSVKAGVVHADAPAAVLESMLAVRIHLDDCGSENGPLNVLPESHLSGKMNADQIANWREKNARECVVRKGGVILMRPLLLHASSPAKVPGHRRVIHIEYAPRELPGGLEWAPTD